MTCRYSNTDWRDVLYTSVRNSPGGVNAAAKFLSERRGKSMHVESLRAKLRGVEGESISMEMAELLTEWMQDMRRPDAKEWLHAFNARFGLAAEEVDAPSAGAQGCDVDQLRDKMLKLAAESGILASLGLDAMSDGEICDRDADAIEAQAMREVRLLFRVSRNARRAANKRRAASLKQVA